MAARSGGNGAPGPAELLWRLSDAARQKRERETLNADAALGRRGEDLAHRYLRRSGWHILARNYRLADASGEIDIVARDGDITVFVEVKARRSAEYGAPERAIGRDKQKRITKAARAFAAHSGIAWRQVRFDVIAIVFTEPPSLLHQRDAFFLGRAI